MKQKESIANLNMFLKTQYSLSLWDKGKVKINLPTISLFMWEPSMFAWDENFVLLFWTMWVIVKFVSEHFLQNSYYFSVYKFDWLLLQKEASWSGFYSILLPLRFCRQLLTFDSPTCLGYVSSSIIIGAYTTNCLPDLTLQKLMFMTLLTLTASIFYVSCLTS